MIHAFMSTFNKSNFIFKNKKMTHNFSLQKKKKSSKAFKSLTQNSHLLIANNTLTN